VALALEQKKAIVSEISEQAKAAVSGVVADYRGLTVEQMNKLRREARDQNIYIRVVHNTLAKRAFQGTDFACFDEALMGPTMIAFSKEDPSSAARLLKDYVKSYEALDVKALAVNGSYMEGTQLDYVANLPNRHEALTMLARVIKAPVGKVVRGLAEPYAKLARATAALRDKKQSES
jgi:large subunit ribosomal protein L10